MSSVRTSISITDLISQFPIFSSLVQYLDLWDLVQLSRTSITVRHLCHGFNEDGAYEKERYVSGTGVRKSLKIGQHRTSTWKLYKSLTQKQCREVDHTRGRDPLGCKLCSKPVCFACIVKHSFNKHESTFLLRGRALCKECFDSGNPHSEHIGVQGSVPLKLAYKEAGLCVCTSQDGILCSDCKKMQNDDSLHAFRNVCAGIECGQSLVGESSGARVCLWCSSILPTASPKHQYQSVHGGTSLQDDLIASSSAVRTTSIPGIPWSPSTVRNIGSPTNLQNLMFRMPRSDSGQVPASPMESVPDEPSLLDDMEIPAYSQYPVDSLPDYRPPQLQVQD